MRVRIVKDPVGIYNLAYVVGEVVDLPPTQAKELIADEYAVETKEPIGHHQDSFTFGNETADSKQKKEKR